MKILHSSGNYQIHFLPFTGSHDVVVTDENVAGYYPDLLGENPIVVPAGEKSKNLETYAFVSQELLKRGVTRKSRIIALGGGVIGDLTGFVAATYMRGISFVQVPTTLLAQVDSSVGGKVGIDLPEGKNLIGAFHPPTEVFIDSRFLATLPAREYRCGMAEVIKYGWIMDEALLSELQEPPTDLSSIVQRCIKHKAMVVQEDEFETLGIRASLNFGHTVGHAIEQITHYERYTHGEAIAIGMVLEAKIAERLGIAPLGLSNQMTWLFEQYGLPTQYDSTTYSQDLIEIMRRDKKSEASEITMSLVTVPGSCKLVKDVPHNVIAEVLGE
jgi:3-dehydroquinate synthase